MQKKLTCGHCLDNQARCRAGHDVASFRSTHGINALQVGQQALQDLLFFVQSALQQGLVARGGSGDCSPEPSVPAGPPLPMARAVGNARSGMQQAESHIGQQQQQRLGLEAHAFSEVPPVSQAAPAQHLGGRARSGTPTSGGTAAHQHIHVSRKQQQQQPKQMLAVTAAAEQPHGTMASAAHAPKLSLEDKHLALALATKGLARLLRAVDDGLSRRRMDPTRRTMLRSATVLALHELICSKVTLHHHGHTVHLEPAVQAVQLHEQQPAQSAPPSPAMQLLVVPVPMVLPLSQQQQQHEHGHQQQQQLQHVQIRPAPELQQSPKRQRISQQAMAAASGMLSKPFLL